ncbi:alpha/beta hydrolase fold domain-containing protein [Halanaerobacter jeridensis]|uniref:Acetyl esterase/lipase n=1 Tax=Halanaerobacter jeridensis TaxID=706427 RepID=A0A938XWR8_9FIRM|nr:alpha/beta hydrolase fold domain-containing protein [Halanaerobacter jeridensis]MBM7557681.1 acetyl esterase/lipase [Halanaerobacter jeridensis]
MFIRAKIKNYKIRNKLNSKKISYGPHERQYLLYLLPEKEKRNSTIFFIHGGGWNKGNPEFFKFIAYYFARHGFSTIMPAYRLVPEFRFPSQENDIFAACKKSVAEIKIEKNNLIIVGQSAGAQLGALLLLNKRKQTSYEIAQDDFTGFLSISGPLDLSLPCVSKRAEKLLSGFVPTPDKRKKANPINYVEEELKTPVFCIHGAKDPLVPKKHSLRFIEEVKSTSKTEVELEIKKSRHHSDLVELFLDEEESEAMRDWLIRIDKNQI